MKPLKSVRRGEPCCREEGTDTGGSDICVGMSTDADRFEVVVGLRNDEGGSLGDVGALDGAEEIV